jgi:hypothetical protein
MVWETKVEKHEPPFYRHFLTCLASVQSKTEEEFVSLLINYSSIYLYLRFDLLEVLGLAHWRRCQRRGPLHQLNISFEHLESQPTVIANNA